MTCLPSSFAVHVDRFASVRGFGRAWSRWLRWLASRKCWTARRCRSTVDVGGRDVVTASGGGHQYPHALSSHLLRILPTASIFERPEGRVRIQRSRGLVVMMSERTRVATSATGTAPNQCADGAVVIGASSVLWAVVLTVGMLAHPVRQSRGAALMGSTTQLLLRVGRGLLPCSCAYVARSEPSLIFGQRPSDAIAPATCIIHS